MKKNWFYGVLIAVAMLFCSASYANEPSVLAPYQVSDSFVVADIGAVSAGVSIDPTDTKMGKLNSVNMSYIDRQLRTSMATSPNYEASSAVTNCNKITDNALAYNEKPVEVGWRL